MLNYIIELIYLGGGEVRKGRKKKLFLFCMLVYILFFISFSGQAVYAMQVDPKQVSSNASSSVSAPKTNGVAVSNFIKFVGASLLGTIVSLISIHKFVIEKNYDIRSIEIYQLYKRPLQNIEFTDFLCKKITKDKRIIEQIGFENPFYLDISIKISIPNGKKTLDSLIIKKLLVNINGYELECVPQKRGKFGLKKCDFNKDENKEICKILLKWPTAREYDDKKMLNTMEMFKDPSKLRIYLEWYPLIVFFPLIAILFPQKRTVVFKEIEHENGVSRIGIIHKGIFKGKKDNENSGL